MVVVVGRRGPVRGEGGGQEFDLVILLWAATSFSTRLVDLLTLLLRCVRTWPLTSGWRAWLHEPTQSWSVDDHVTRFVSKRLSRFFPVHEKRWGFTDEYQVSYIYIYKTKKKNRLSKLFIRYAQIFGPAAFPRGSKNWLTCHFGTYVIVEKSSSYSVVMRERERERERERPHTPLKVMKLWHWHFCVTGTTMCEQNSLLWLGVMHLIRRVLQFNIDLDCATYCTCTYKNETWYILKRRTIWIININEQQNSRI